MVSITIGITKKIIKEVNKQIMSHNNNTNKNIFNYTQYSVQEETERTERRKQRMMEMRRRKKQQEIIRRLFIPCVVVLTACIICAGLGISRLVKSYKTHKAQKTIQYAILNIAGCHADNAAAGNIEKQAEKIETLTVRTLGGKNDKPPLKATSTEATAALSAEVESANGIFIDVEDQRILGQRDAGVRISPASMTKILTILVAAENITNPDDIFEITREITDYSYVNGCSNAGFDVGEKVTVRDLFYGTVLPSGADAAMALAIYTSGSHEEFVNLMNAKIDELGLSKTSHFTNCVGLYDENHYSTVYDIAVMLKAACDNSFCREVLNAHTYKTSITEKHPEGIDLSNLFLRRIEDKDTNGEILCAKTGYVVQSGSCAASLARGNDGREYICVTAHASNSWKCIYDHVAICQQFLAS